MRRRGNNLVPLLLAGTAVWAAAPAGATPPPAVFRVEGLPFLVTRPAKVSHVRHRSDRTALVQEQLNVSIQNAEPHVVSLKEERKPVAAGGQINVRVTDTTTASSSEYLYDPGTNTLTLTTGASRVSVTKDPTGAYSVDGETAGSARAAVETLKHSAGYRDADPHGLLAAYSLLQQDLPAVKIPSDCGSSGTHTSHRRPSLSDVFDCLACDASGIFAQCLRCQ